MPSLKSLNCRPRDAGTLGENRKFPFEKRASGAKLGQGRFHTALHKEFFIHMQDFYCNLKFLFVWCFHRNGASQ